MTKVLIDTDPGTDDAIALMIALGSPELEVLGLTTVGGNATLAHTTRNALRIVEHIGRSDVPVSRGASRPLRGSFQYAYDFHGPAGLTVRLPVPRSRPLETRAPEFITQTASRNPGELVIIALGPLTNLARALLRQPRLVDWTREIVVMGGAVEVPGNVTRHAEFNIFNDPGAASLVLSSGIPVTLVGLDVTMRTSVARVGAPWVEGEGTAARLSRRLIANWFRSRPQEEVYHLHDPLAVAAVVRPDLLTYSQAQVTVEQEDPVRLGRTSARYGLGTVRVALGVDVDKAVSFMGELLAGSC